MARRITARLEALEVNHGSRMIVAKLEAGGDLGAVLRSAGIDRQPDDLLVRITRPDGCGSDYARVL